jgi:hypothetical protein
LGDNVTQTKLTDHSDQKKRRHRVVRLAAWSERRWQRLERFLCVTAPNAALREEIHEALARYVAAPDLTLQLFLHADDPEPVPAATVRATARALAETAWGARNLGVELVLPRAAQVTLVELLVRHLLRDDAELVRRRLPDDVASEGYQSTSGPSPWHLGPGQVACLAVRAQALAVFHRDPPGPPVDVALLELVWRLTRIIERYCGPKSATLTWSEDRTGSGRSDGRAGEYRGRLFEVVRLLQPAMPAAANSIATASASTLGARLDRARRQGNRLRRRLADQ